MVATNSLDDMLPVRLLMVNGVLQAFADALDLTDGFETSSTVDAESGMRTLHVIAKGIGGHSVVHRISGTGTIELEETEGDILVIVSAMTGPITVKFTKSTDTLTDGMRVTVKVKDRTFSDVNTLTVDGNGNVVEYEGIAAPVPFTPEILGNGGSITWALDLTGAEWVSE